MKRILLITLLLSLILIPIVINAAGLVPCGNPGEPACGIKDFFTMLSKIYDFLVLYIATPFAILGLTIGGVLLLISAGNPGLAQKGKDALKFSIIGLILAFGSWLIIRTLLSSMGYIYNF